MQSIEDIFCQKLGESSFLLYQNLFLPAYLTNIGDAATPINKGTSNWRPQLIINYFNSILNDKPFHSILLYTSKVIDALTVFCIYYSRFQRCRGGDVLEFLPQRKITLYMRLNQQLIFVIRVIQTIREILTLSSRNGNQWNQ